MMIKNLIALLIFFSLACTTRKTLSIHQEEIKRDSIPRQKDSLLSGLLHLYPQYFDTLIQQNKNWSIQIIYTSIDRRQDNYPIFTDHYFNINADEYFYPASTVKMPVAFLSLQKLNELNIQGLDKNTTMITETAFSGQTSVYNDPSTTDGRPNIAQYIRKIFLVSDNNAFNRLYEFLGQQYINDNLHRMGYETAQILHRLNIGLTEAENRQTNPVHFFDARSKLIYEQPALQSSLQYQPRNTLLGKGYFSGDSLINRPFDFSKKNRLTLPDLHSILKSVLFPDAAPKQKRFNLKPDDYSFLYRLMSMKPGESFFPSYDSSYTGAYSKFLLYGGKGDIDPGMRIFNKEGDAYGFLTDVSYIVDFNKGVEFLLSATITCNSDEIFNDDHYDYENVGLPFMKNLGKVIYDYELKRKKKNPPDLSKFKFDYTNF